MNSGNEALVRAAQPGDARALMALRLYLLDGEPPADGAWITAGEAWFAERLAADDRFTAVVVESSGQVVASAAGMLLPRMPQPDRRPWRGHLTSVATRPEHRRLGYARACVIAVCDRLTQMGAAYVELNATPGVQQLYARLGFVLRDGDPQMRWTPPQGAPPGGRADG